MVQIIWIFAFAGTITSGICSILHRPLNLEWLFDANNSSITEQPQLERSLCTTKQCEKLAKMIIDGMNTNVDPCDDFYEFACGNWKAHNPLPPGEEYWTAFVKIQRNVDKRLEEILTSEPKPEDLYDMRFSKRAYKACMNTDAMDKAGLQPLISTLWRAGGWPLIMEEEEWDEGIYKWQSIDDYYAYIIGLNTFHDLHVDQYSWDVDDVSIFINTPHLPPHMDKLITLEEMDMDSSDENNDSGEGSQEEGSEEKDKDNNEDDEDEDEDDEDEDEDEDNEDEDEKEEDEYKHELNLHNKKTVKQRVNRKLTNKKKMNKQIKRRTKRVMIEVPSKHKKNSDHKTVHGIRQTHKLSKYRPVPRSNSIKEFVSYANPKHIRKYENTNNDLYFSDSDNEGKNINDNVIDNTDMNEVESINENQNEVNGSGSSNDDNETDEKSGSGSGDYDDEDGSGSGDYDDEDGSGSGDYDDENGSGSGDYDEENGSGSGDYDEEDGSGSDEEDEDSDDDNSSEEKRKRMEEMERVKKFRVKYAEYILNVSMTLAEARGVPIPKEKLKKDIADLLEFQINFAKLMYLSGEELKITLESFQKKYNCLVPLTDNGKISWIRKIRNVFASGGMEIDKKAELIIPSFRYIKHLQKLLDKTPSKTIVNYVHWNFISKVLKTTTKEMRGWYYGLRNEEVTVRKRSDLCIRDIQARYSLGYEYVKKYFSDKIKQTASDMIDNIEKEVEYQIKESTWMDVKTKHAIIDKLVYLKKLIGYPNSYRNNTIMKQHLKGLSVSRSHYDNTLNIMKYLKLDRLKLIITNEMPPEEIPLDPLIANAFFISIFNVIEITAADFQTPFFDFDQPWYSNFGGIGYIMAHEVNHGFDNTGRVYDKYGKYMEWLPKMAEAYEKRAECFEHQFTKYSVVDNKTGNIQMKDYGVRTKGENIADTLGLQAAFKAYQRRQRECKELDPVLPGLQDFGNEQLFFLSFATLWCQNMTPDQLQLRITKDPHSLGSLRVIGSVSNSEDFAKAYNCPEGSPMNPKKKCNIWK